MLARVLLLAASTLLVASTLSESARAQQQGAPGDSNVQTSVPAGRGAGGLAPPGGRGRAGGPPPAPAPRSADGKIVLGGATPAVKGVWLPDGGAGVAMADPTTVPLQPWAKAVLENRRNFQLEPHTRCKPSGGIRQFLTPYGVEFVDFPELQRMYIFDIGGPHTYRTIYMDGRPHPPNLQPSYYGHSIGRWEGDTFVVDTTGFNESFWIDRRGTPHTEQLRIVERFTRMNAISIKYEVTLDDPGAFTAPWTTGMNLRWEDGTELFEYVCQQSNQAPNLMVGDETTIDRSSAIVP
jgi:hypothetical protein